MAPRKSAVTVRRKASAATELDCATAFQKVALGCVAAVKSHRVGACAGDAEAVHQVRVAITRLRAVVAFFASVVVDAEWLRLKAEITWLNGSLGTARDSDVVMEYARGERYREWVQQATDERLDRQRMQDRRRMVRSLRSARFEKFVAALERWVRQGAWLTRWQRRKKPVSLQCHCEAELDRWRRRLVRKGRHLETLEPSRRHRLRIKAKRFRYMLEALREIAPLRARLELGHLHGPAKRLQGTLGDLRDLERFADVAVRPGQAGAISRQGRHPPGYRRRKEKLLDDAIEAYRRFARL